MEIKDLTPGRPVEISLLKKDNKGEIIPAKDIFISSLFDISNQGDVVVNMPSRQGRYISLPLDMQYFVVIYTSLGIFQFIGTIYRQGKLESFPVYVIRPESELKKIQRREFYRFDCHIPVTAVPVSKEMMDLPNMDLISEKMNEISSSAGITGTIVNISGGGARINSSKNICNNEFLSLMFTLNTPKNTIHFNLLGKSVTSSYNKESGVYENRIEFVFKDIEDREIIIKYIFDEDRRLRKKSQG